MYIINIKSPYIDWNTLYFGVKKGFLLPETVINYASFYIEKNPDEENADIINLLILEDIRKENVLSLLFNILEQKNNKQSDSHCERVLRYAILDFNRTKFNDNYTLLEFIEGVYEDFDYPEDMNNFITYMPVSDTNYDPSDYTDEENLNRLVTNFEMFMKNEYSWLQKIHFIK